MNGNFQVRGAVEVGRSPSLTEEHTAERKEDATEEKKRYRVELFTLIIVLIYAGLTAWEAYLSWSSRNDAREHFTKDQSPYIWIKPTLPIVRSNEKFVWNIDLLNYGKSPALNVRSCILGEWGTSAPSHINDLPPNLDGTECVTAISPSLVIPPGGDMFTSAGAGMIFTQKQAEIINSMDYGLVLHGISDYSDSSGNIYESAFCLSRLATGAVASCGDTRSNYIRQKKEGNK